MKLKKVTEEDCKNMLAFIEMMAQRGAIKGEELLAVGALRNNIANAPFVEEISPTPKKK